MDNTDTIFEQLTSHPFVKIAFKNGIEVAQALETNHAYEVDVKYSRDPNEYEYYVVEVGHTLAHFLSICEQMIYAVHFLSVFSPTQKMKEKGINRSNHIQYNVENYLIRTQSLSDRILKLTNAVFHLGIDQRNCKFDTISKNLHVKMTKIPGRLKKLSKTLEKYRQDRNTIIHHESYLENDLHELEMLHLVKSKSKEYEVQNIEGLTNLTNRLTRTYVKQKSDEFNKFNEEVFKEVLVLFNDLQKKYEQIENELRLKCGHAS